MPKTISKSFWFPKNPIESREQFRVAWDDEVKDFSNRKLKHTVNGNGHSFALKEGNGLNYDFND
jgi:hypothetical protein